MKKIVFMLMLLVILATILVPVVIAVPPYDQEGYRDSYVILTNIDESDPYYSGVALLKNYRNASAVHFIDFINDTYPAQRALWTSKPYYIAVAVKPEKITRKFVEKTLDVLRQLDDDDCIDCAVGFITAANAQDLENLVANTIRAEQEQRPKKFTSIINSESDPPLNTGFFSNALTQTEFFSEIGWETSAVDIQTSAPPEIYSEIGNSSFITLTMHGNGAQVGSSTTVLTNSDVKAGPDQYLYPAVTIALPCYCGCASQIIDEKSGWESFMNPNDSFALSFLKKGAVGYVGHLREAGPNLNILQPTLYGMAFLNMTQGEAMTYAYNKLLFSPTNEEVFSSPYLFSYLLYGDPAYKPVNGPLAPPILKEGTIINQNEIKLELCFTRNVTLPTPLNPTGYYNDENKWSGLFALPLHYQYILPENYKVMSVSVSDFSDPDSKITQVNVQDWVIEETLDENILHIALDITWTDYRDICEGATISLNLGVTVIPEFSSIILLLLFMTAALIAVTVNRRKYAVKH